ncbi:MAG: biotin--[acetyl-CoA-carboxylase] ligase, partial [Ferruginibacter sp.]
RLAKHGQAWFSKEQTKGKGQRGKSWESAAGENIILTVALQPPVAFKPGIFTFNALIALACVEFLSKLAESDFFFIKWPNDLYVRDRKAGGILIENVIQGEKWSWALVGVGININQIVFPNSATNAISLQQLTGKSYDVEELSRHLHQQIIATIDSAAGKDETKILQDYNLRLYKKDNIVRLKKSNAIFSTTLTRVNKFGQLLTHDVIERSFSFGEVELLRD